MTLFNKLILAFLMISSINLFGSQADQKVKEESKDFEFTRHELITIEDQIINKIAKSKNESTTIEELKKYFSELEFNYKISPEQLNKYLSSMHTALREAIKLGLRKVLSFLLFKREIKFFYFDKMDHFKKAVKNKTTYKRLLEIVNKQ